MKDFDFNITKEDWQNLKDWILDVIPDILSAVIILVVGLWVIKIIRKLLRKFFQAQDYDVTLEKFLYDLVGVGLKILLIVLVITQLGVKTTSLVAILGAAGLAVGLALQGSLANFAGGVLILFFKPFKVGDWIEAQGVSGSVKEISIFTTKLNTFQNQLAVVPNGKLSNDNIINYSAENKRREDLEFGIAYESDIDTTRKVLMDLIKEQDGVINDPAPEVIVKSLGDSAVVLALRYFASNDKFWNIHFTLLEQGKKRLEAAGVSIPFPQTDVNVFVKKDFTKNLEKNSSN